MHNSGRASADSRNETLFQAARQVLVGGVSSSARVCRAFGDRPMYVARGDGARVWDVDGREYIDLCTSHGASLLGHGHPAIVAALRQAGELGILCSHETEHHAALARKIVELVPCAEMVRFTGSGTETTLHALRLARALTGRERILKFTGHFHGYHDFVMFEPGADPHDGSLVPQSAGVPPELARYLVIVPDNDPDALEQAFRRHGPEIAAVIMEPIHYNAGCIVPERAFVGQVQSLAHANGSLLIFDEVLSGFRMAPGGAQEFLGVTPDLCTLGKALGGGLPLSAICGRREVMEGLRPVGPVQHSGTYNAPLVCILAGLAALEAYSTPGFYAHIRALGERLTRGIEEIIARSGVKARVQGLGARFGLYFGIEKPVRCYRQSLENDTALTERFIAAAWRNGVYFHDYGGRGAHHHGFSAAHTAADIDRALEGIEAAFRAIR